MSQRIQRALDGELPADQLTPEERVELHRFRATIGTALDPIRQLPSIDAAPEILRRIATGDGRLTASTGSPTRGAFRRLLDWFWSPQSLTLRPAHAFAGAIAVAALVVGSARTTAPVRATAPARVIVQFRLGESDAQQVSLVGDFNGWRPRPEHRLHRIAAGVWSVDVALQPGVYNYGFVIDGKTWRLDPLAPRVTDGFGGASSRLAVLATAARS